VVVDVPEGTTVEIEVKRAGYVAQRVALDGKTGKLMVRLERGRAAAPVHGRPQAGPRPGGEGTPAKAKPKAGAGGGEIVNPWAR